MLPLSLQTASAKQGRDGQADWTAIRALRLHPRFHKSMSFFSVMQKSASFLKDCFAGCSQQKKVGPRELRVRLIAQATSPVTRSAACDARLAWFFYQTALTSVNLTNVSNVSITFGSQENNENWVITYWAWWFWWRSTIWCTVTVWFFFCNVKNNLEQKKPAIPPPIEPLLSAKRFSVFFFPIMKLKYFFQSHNAIMISIIIHKDIIKVMQINKTRFVKNKLVWGIQIQR